MAGSTQCCLGSVGQVLSVKTIDGFISSGSKDIPEGVDIKLDPDQLFDNMLRRLRQEDIGYVCSASAQSQENPRMLRTAHYRTEQGCVLMRLDAFKVPFNPPEDRYAIIIIGKEVDARIAQLKEQFPQLVAFKQEQLGLERYNKLRAAFPQYPLP